MVVNNPLVRPAISLVILLMVQKSGVHQLRERQWKSHPLPSQVVVWDFFHPAVAGKKGPIEHLDFPASYVSLLEGKVLGCFSRCLFSILRIRFFRRKTPIYQTKRSPNMFRNFFTFFFWPRNYVFVSGPRFVFFFVKKKPGFFGSIRHR